MSRYKAYREYKDSGKTWLGKVPAHWEISPLKYLANFSGGGTPSKENPGFWSGDIPWVSPKDMKTARISSTIDSVTAEAIKRSSANLLDEGALLMVVRSGILQHSIPVAINDVPVTLNQDMKALRFCEPCFTEYAFYLVSGNQSQLLLEWHKEGATVESIEQEYLANSIFPCPPIAERKAIAAFLDHETAKIDALIEKQRRLIELLKEKRQAVISHAVTKGLNPNAPIKDSGVEWLGEVPAHWRVASLGYYAQISTGATPDRSNPNYWNGTIPWIKTGEVKYDEIFEVEEYISEEAVTKSSVKLSPPGTVLMAMYGQGVTRGRVAILGVAATYNQACAAINTNQEIWNKYLICFFMAAYHAIRDDGNETSQMNLNADIVGKFKISIPSLDEQRQIVGYITPELEKFDSMIDRAETAIALMQERRTALISAAVTGKIDVRDWLPTAAQDEAGIECCTNLS